MASRGIAGVLSQTHLLLILTLLPCAITGTQLVINNSTVDYHLPTTPNVTQSLWCGVQNHSQGEELRWFRGDGQVRLKDGNKVNTSNICISPVTVEDTGVSFTCQLARNASVKLTVVLEVQFSPILSGEVPSSVEEENDVTLDCHVKANPPARMVWFKDNSALTLEKSRHQLYQTSELFQLKIARAQKSDSGLYTCMAESDLGAMKKDFPVIVKDGKLPFPTEAVIAAAVVVLLTTIFAIVARWKRIAKCCGRKSDSSNNTSL